MLESRPKVTYEDDVNERNNDDNEEEEVVR
jgi:hypothetical protein